MVGIKQGKLLRKGKTKVYPSPVRVIYCVMITVMKGVQKKSWRVLVLDIGNRVVTWGFYPKSKTTMCPQRFK